MVELWNLIRDWFVQYIWGGMTSDLRYFTGFIGEIHYYQKNGDTDNIWNANLNDILFPIGSSYGDLFAGSVTTEETFYEINMADWLSTTSTIIVLVLLLVAFGFLIVGIFRLFSRMFALRS